MKEASFEINAYFLIELITNDAVDTGHEAAAESRIPQHHKRNISEERLDLPQHIVNPEHVRLTHISLIPQK